MEETITHDTFEIDSKNYATSDDLAARASEFLKKIVNDSVTNRRVLDQNYIQWYNIYKTIFDKQFYKGKSEVYVPLLRRMVETAESRLMKALFPTDDLFYVEPADPQNEQFAQVVGEHLKWQLEKRVQLKQNVWRFLRQFLMYGWSPIKCVWDRKTKNVFGLQKIQTPIKTRQFDEVTQSWFMTETGQFKTEIKETTKEFVLKNNPTFLPVDIFHFYVYPVTANSMDEVFGCFEFVRKGLSEIKEQGKPHDGMEPDYVRTEDVKPSSNPFPFTLQWSAETRLSTQGISNSAQNTSQLPMATLVEYWGLFNFGTEDDPSWEEATITCDEAWSTLQIRKNQYYDQSKPYLVARMTQVQNEFYSDGYIAPLAPLQYYFNDVLNQVFDGLCYTLNPIIKYDPGRVVNVNSIAFAPGAMWALSDPAAAILEAPQDVSRAGFQAAEVVQSMVESYPGLQPIPMTGRKAATHISAIQQEYSLPLMDMAESIEEQVMSPWLKKAFMLNQQYIDDTEVFLVTGKNGRKFWQRLSPEMLVGDYNFFWNGANQATNLHVRSQQMMGFVNMLAPLAEIMAQQGKQVDWTYLSKRIWREGLGLNGEDQLILDAAKNRSIDPRMENFLLENGHYLPTSLDDPDEQHLQVHQEVQDSPLAQQHMQEHNDQLQQKQAMQQAAQSQQPSSMMEQGQEAGVPGEQQLEGVQPGSNQPGNPSGINQ